MELTAPPKCLKQIDFSLEKYTKKFLIDVGRIENLDGYVRDDTPHQLSFYDITFIQSGSASFSLDEEVIHLDPCTILFSSPYQVRVWKSTDKLKGIALFFLRDFVNTLFNDRFFLDRFAFFDNNSNFSHIKVPRSFFDEMIDLLEEMEVEFHIKEKDSNEILASNLYKILTKLNREVRKLFSGQSIQINARIHRFKQLLEESFITSHDVGYYADLLSITPPYLNDLCKKHLGLSASRIIKDRLTLEAKRLILYSGLSIKEIAFALNFSNSANFNRFFKKNVGCSPGSYLQHSSK